MSQPWLYVSAGLQVGSRPRPPRAQLLVVGFENASGQLSEQDGSKGQPLYDSCDDCTVRGGVTFMTKEKQWALTDQCGAMFLPHTQKKCWC